MTEWVFLRTEDWALDNDDHPGVTARVCEFLGTENRVQVIAPATGRVDAGEAMLDWIRDRVHLIDSSAPVRLYVHPDRRQLDSIVEHGLPDGERALVLLWSREPGFEAWIYSRDGSNLADDTTVAPDPVVVTAMSSVPGNHRLDSGVGRDRLVEVLGALHRAEYSLHAPELETAGAAAGMGIDDLHAVRAHADRFLEGTPFRVSKPMLRADVVEVWEHKVGEQQK